MLLCLDTSYPTYSCSVIKIYKYIFATLTIECFTWNVSEVSAAKMLLSIFIWKPQGVGLYRRYSPNMQKNLTGSFDSTQDDSDVQKDDSGTKAGMTM